MKSNFVESTSNTPISLAEAESRAREKDRERAHLVGQLGEQNQRLTGELESASRREEELTRQLEELRVQFQDKRETMRDHVMHLETLKDEVKLPSHVGLCNLICGTLGMVLGQ